MADDDVKKKKRNVFLVRLTDQQLALIKRAADQDMIPAATWARRAIVRALSKALKTPLRGIVPTDEDSEGPSTERKAVGT